MSGEQKHLMVKICGITTEADALLAVGLGADAIGFVFAPSPRQVSPQAVAHIVERLPRDIMTVGVFRNEARARVVEIVNGIGLRAAQLHGDETADDTRFVAERVPFTIKAFPAGHRGIRRFDEYGANAVMVDSPSPGSGNVFDWRLAEGVVDPSKMIVSGGLHSGNVGDAIAHLHPMGVDVSSGVESEPGRKDPRRLRAFVVAARTAAGEDIDGAGNAVDRESGLVAAAAGLDRGSSGGGGQFDSSGGGQFESEDDGPFDWQEDA